MLRYFQNNFMEKVAVIASGFGGLCNDMHQELMQHTDNEVLGCLQEIYTATDILNEGKNKYTNGTHVEETVHKDEDGNEYTLTQEVPSTLDYYLNEDTDSGIRKMYDLYEEDYKNKVKIHSPEKYDELIKTLDTDNKDNRALLFVGELGTYNKTLDEGSYNKYFKSIVIGVAVLLTVVVTVATVGAAAPAIVAALGMSSGVVALGTAGIAYGAGVGLGVGLVAGNAGYLINVNCGQDGYALDGTYITEESKKSMYKSYLTDTIKSTVVAGAAAGAGAALMVETAWDLGELILAGVKGDKLGVYMSTASLFLAGDDILKTVNKLDGVTVVGKQGTKNIDDLYKSGGKTFDKFDDIPQSILDTKPSYSGNPKKWYGKGGKIEILDDGNWKYINKNGDSVIYKGNNADFSPYYNKDYGVVSKDEIFEKGYKLTGDSAADKATMEKFYKEVYGIDKTKYDSNYTWHHLENGDMVLVETSIHSDFTHIGGASGYRNGELP